MMHRARRPPARSAGFTLVELMVALTVTAAVVATIYTIGGASARNFHEQQRISQLQLAVRMAMDRLRRDLERAGMHGVGATAAVRLGHTPPAAFAAVNLRNDDPGSRAALSAIPGASSNPTQADAISITGNFVTSDAYLVRSIAQNGMRIELQCAWQGFRRSFSDTVADPRGNTFDAALFRQVFSVGRMLHLQTLNDYHFFVRITGASLVQGPTPEATRAQIDVTPALPIGGLQMQGLGEGSLVAPITEIRYQLMEPAPDLPAVADPLVTGPRTVLARIEREIGTGAVLSQQTVLEWAVHFDVDAVVDVALPGNPPNLQVLDDAAAQAAVAANPQNVRALLVEIAARTAEQDPQFPFVPSPPAIGPSSYLVFPGRPGAARLRSARAEISLPNLVTRL